MPAETHIDVTAQANVMSHELELSPEMFKLLNFLPVLPPISSYWSSYADLVFSVYQPMSINGLKLSINQLKGLQNWLK